MSLKRCTIPRAVIIDSQSIELGILTAKACGMDGCKLVKGRKRHVLVDTLGLVMFVLVTAANVSDYNGARRLLQTIDKTAFPRLFLFWADGGYRADSFIRWIWLVTLRPDKTKGFVVIPKRWVVERIFGWFHECRKLSKNYEALPETAEAFIYLAMIRIMLRRLA